MKNNMTRHMGASSYEVCIGGAMDKQIYSKGGCVNFEI